MYVCFRLFLQAGPAGGAVHTLILAAEDTHSRSHTQRESEEASINTLHRSLSLSNTLFIVPTAYRTDLLLSETAFKMTDCVLLLTHFHNHEAIV